MPHTTAPESEMDSEMMAPDTMAPEGELDTTEMPMEMSDDDVASALGYITTIGEHVHRSVHGSEEEEPQDEPQEGEQEESQEDMDAELEPEEPEEPEQEPESEPEQEEPITRDVLHEEVRAAVEEVMKKPEDEIASIKEELEKLLNADDE